MRSAANAAGATAAIHGAAKPSNHMLPACSTTPTSATANATAPNVPAVRAWRRYTATRATASRANDTA